MSEFYKIDLSCFSSGRFLLSQEQTSSGNVTRTPPLKDISNTFQLPAFAYTLRNYYGCRHGTTLDYTFRFTSSFKFCCGTLRGRFRRNMESVRLTSLHTWDGSSVRSRADIDIALARVIDLSIDELLEEVFSKAIEDGIHPEDDGATFG